MNDARLLDATKPLEGYSWVVAHSALEEISIGASPTAALPPARRSKAARVHVVRRQPDQASALDRLARSCEGRSRPHGNG